MTLYDVFCLVLCVFAVFGGYVALHVAVRAICRPGQKACAGNCEKCGACSEDRDDCPEKGTAEDEAAKKD